MYIFITNRGLATFPFPLLWSFLMQTMVRLKDKHSRMSESRECNASVYSPVPLRGKIDPSWNALEFQFLTTSKLGCANLGGFWHDDVILPLCYMLRPYVIMIFMRLFFRFLCLSPLLLASSSHPLGDGAVIYWWPVWPLFMKKISSFIFIYAWLGQTV